MDDKSSLVSAMKNAHAVFAVTNYWADMNAEHEIKQGRNLVDAAKESGVKHFVWSSLLNIKKRRRRPRVSLSRRAISDANSCMQ